MGLLIKNGEIVTGDSHYVADIWCENETITRIDRKIDPPAGAEVIDASGKYIFPGFIDPHTHIYLPFMGTYSKDDYETGTKAALVGGTTTIFDMCCPLEPVAISIITLGEFAEGFENIHDVEAFLSCFRMIPLSRTIAYKTAAMQAHLPQRLGENDAWIAATALAYRAELAGRERAFTRVPRLKYLAI